MILYHEFNEIEIDIERANAIDTFNNAVARSPGLTVIEKDELRSDIVLGYITTPWHSFD